MIKKSFPELPQNQMPVPGKVDIKGKLICDKCGCDEMVITNIVELIEITNPYNINQKQRNINMRLANVKCFNCSATYTLDQWVKEIEKQAIAKIEMVK